MNILLVHDALIPVSAYGGTERVMWYLGKELAGRGHRVSFLVRKGSSCPFATVIHLDPDRPVARQIPPDTEVVHFHGYPVDPVDTPYLVTIHGNSSDGRPLDRNAVFVSRNHAERHGSTSFVYNGLGWDDYGPVSLSRKEDYFHFLGNAAWRRKNVAGAISLIRRVEGARLKVLGGHRLNFNMGFRLTLSPKVSFCGMVGGEEKLKLLRHSKGLIFPVRWHEPFGLALTESLYFGCPVFGTPYGSLPEIVPREVGFLSNRISELQEAITNVDAFSPERCHEHAVEHFGAGKMADEYERRYETVVSGAYLNPTPPRLEEVQSRRLLDWVE